MLRHARGEDDDSVKEDETVLPLHTRKDDVDHALEYGRGVFQTVRHSIEPKGTKMGREGGLVTIARMDRDLPVSRVSIERGEDRGIYLGVDAFVHAWESVGVTHREGVEAAVIDAKHE